MLPPDADTQRDPLTERIIGSAITVDKALGPGLLESTYEACLTWELAACGMSVARQHAVPVVYRGNSLSVGYRVDLLVEGEVIVEIKAVDRVNPIVEAQVLTYLKLLQLRRALICNFNVTLLRDGIKRLLR